jgi:hypothetical protein
MHAKVSRMMIDKSDQVDVRKLALCLGIATAVLALSIVFGPPARLSDLLPRHPDILDWWQISVAALNGTPIPEVVFNYPPLFAVFNLPLGLLDFPSAYFAFLFGTLFCYTFIVGYISRSKLVLILVIISVATLFNFRYGQNGLLTAAIGGAALIQLQQGRQILAGILIGLLSIKPHLGLLFPIALVAIGAWRAILSATVTALTMLTVSLGLLGINAYFDWFSKMSGLINEIPQHLWGHVPTTFSFMLSIGASTEIAYFSQIALTILVMISVWRVWRHCDSWPIRCAVLTTATCLTSPYLMTVDLSWLGLSLAWLMAMGLKSGWLRGERITIFLVCVLPYLYISVAHYFAIQIGQFVIALLLLLLLRRSQVFKNSGVNQSHSV